MPTPVNDQVIKDLLNARLHNRKVETSQFSSIEMQQAYEIQQRLIAGYLKQNQAKHSGWKVALSGAPAQHKYAIDEPVYGQLTTDMQLNSADTIYCSQDELPKFEIELAFRLKQDLLAQQIYTDQSLIQAIDVVIPALEIANVRWQDWNFSLGQFIADNSAASKYVLGKPLSMTLDDVMTNIEIEQSSHALVLTFSEQDNALKNYLWLVRKLLSQGMTLSTGEIILTGSLIRPLNMDRASYEVQLFGQTLSIEIANAVS